MKPSVLLLIVALVGGCASHRSWHDKNANLRLPRIERELNFYVATHPWHATNHFFVYPTDFRHDQPLTATVYWKEERTILRYNELEPDAPHDVFAWRGREVKLDRDTVDTQEEIGGSDYLETHREWIEDVERCIYRGKEFSVSKSEAQERFPNQQTEPK
jgi:hypothetical protein